MKLQPPVPATTVDEPYKEDLFQRQVFGDALTKIFTGSEESLVVCINAPWGDGKTTFAHMWKASLEQEGKNVIYFDAYAHDYAEDPYIAFCAEIIELIDETSSPEDSIHSIKNEFKEKAKKFGVKLLGTTLKTGIKTVTAGVVDECVIDEVGKAVKEFRQPSSIFTTNAFDDYIEAKKLRSEFRTSLSGLGAKLREKQEFPLLIIVDELDRCRPDYALLFIERIKHLFSMANVSFLMLVNLEQLQNYVKTIYGSEVDACNYLHKFFTFSVDLPKRGKYVHVSDINTYVDRLIDYHNVSWRIAT